MSLNSSILRRVAALNLEPDAMREVLAIFAEIMEADEARKAKQRERTARSRDRNVTVTAQSRYGNSYPPHSPPLPPAPPSPPLNPPQKNLVHRASSNGRHIFQTEFKEWYQVYPRHEGKVAAEKAFAKVRASGVSLEILKAGAERYRGQPIEAQFRKLPATWLNAGCWDDEFATGPPQTNGHAVPQQVFRYEDLPNYYDVVKDAVKPGETNGRH